MIAFRRLAGFVLAVGVALKAWAAYAMQIQSDGGAYVAMGEAFRRHGSFLMPWGDGLSYASEPSFSHHYPPLFPLWLAGWSFTGLPFEVGNFVLACTAIATVYFLGKNLWGKNVGSGAAALVAVLPRLAVVTGTGFSENLSTLLFCGIVWAIVKSIERPAFMVVAGSLAGLAYLTRAGMGAFFLIAATGGLAWRLKHRGWRATVSNSYYWAGGLIFLTCVAAWGIRNQVLFGDPNTSDYTQAAQAYAFTHLGLLGLAFVFKMALFMALGLLFVAAFPEEWKKAVAQWRGEADSALLLSVGLVAGIGALMAALYWTVERAPLMWIDSERYVVIAYPVLLWAVMRQAKPESRGFKIRYAALAVMLILGSCFYVLQPTHSAANEAASHLELEAGDSIGIYGASLGRYAFYEAMPRHDVKLFACQGNVTDPCPGASPKYILDLGTGAPLAGYELVRSDWVDFLVGGKSGVVYTYRSVLT